MINHRSINCARNPVWDRAWPWYLKKMSPCPVGHGWNPYYYLVVRNYTLILQAYLKTE